MELVGIVVAYREESGGLHVLFRCTNKEEFDLKVSPAIKRIPPGVLVRVVTERPPDELGMPRKENVLTRWQEL